MDFDEGMEASLKNRICLSAIKKMAYFDYYTKEFPFIKSIYKKEIDQVF